MEYFTKPELVRLLGEAYKSNKMHHLAMLVTLTHGLRVSEVVGKKGIKGSNIFDNQIRVKRLKGSNKTIQTLRHDSDPLFDETPLIELSKEKKESPLFPWSRQYSDQLIKKYGKAAGINPDKLNWHTFKHSTAMLLWDETKSLGIVKTYLGHKSPSSTLIYLAEDDSKKGQQAFARINMRKDEGI